MLKSTPPAWAGTAVLRYRLAHNLLKSTPPAWAGTDFHSLYTPK